MANNFFVPKFAYDLEGDKRGIQIRELSDRLLLKEETEFLHGLPMEDMKDLSEYLENEYLKAYINYQNARMTIRLLKRGIKAMYADPTVREKVLLRKNVSKLPFLTAGVSAILMAGGVHTLADLQKKSRNDLLAIKGMKERWVDKIAKKMSSIGFPLRGIANAGGGAASKVKAA